MWLRSEKRSSRIAQSNTKTSINLRKIIKNTPALKNLKQTTAAVTPNRRLNIGSVCAASSTAKIGKTFRKNGSAKQLPTTKCNIKNQTGVKRLIKKGKSSTCKRHDKKKFVTVAKTIGGDQQKRVRLPRNSLQTLSVVGKENRWTSCIIDKRRGRMRTTAVNSSEHHESTDSIDTVQVNLPRAADTCSDLALASDNCDSCKPSTACSCSSSSIQTNDVQSHRAFNVPKMDCVNATFVECDSTTDNDRTSAPSTSMLINPVGFLIIFYAVKR